MKGVLCNKYEELTLEDKCQFLNVGFVHVHACVCVSRDHMLLWVPPKEKFKSLS